MDDLIRRSDAVKAMAKAVGRILYDADAISYHTMQAIPAVDAVPKEFHDKTCMALFERHIEEMLAVEPKHGEWIPCSERLPSEEERREWIDNNLDGIGYLYPCLVTRYSSINPDRTKNNPYVAKHYYDGEDFVNGGEEVCSEYILAWMPLPEPWEGADDE